MKKVITMLMLCMFLISAVSASEKIVNIPEGLSWDQFKQKVIVANRFFHKLSYHHLMSLKRFVFYLHQHR